MPMTSFPRTGCWHRFTPADWRFIAEALSLSDKGRESLATMGDDPEAVRHVADHPRVFEALVMSPRAALVSPELFFLVVVRHTLKGIGVDDLEVADYMAVVCADFGVPPRSAMSTTQPQPERLYSLDWIQALENARGHERFFIHVQCANQFLVLTCLYPDFLHHRAERRGAPDVVYYEGVVSTHLDAAGRHVLAEEFALREVLTRLANFFPPVRRAMNHTLREFLSLGS
jgi:hypothetical protein